MGSYMFLYNNKNKNYTPSSALEKVIIFDKKHNIEQYRIAKEEYREAKEKEDFDLISISLKKYIEYAIKLNKIEVATWQYNNLAYYNIMEFCYRTDYENRKNIIYKMKNGIDKENYINESKKIFLLEYIFIEEAEKYIIQAEILNNHCDIAQNEERTKYINNNSHFINEIKKFLDK
jgi:hypothetical protein